MTTRTRTDATQEPKRQLKLRTETLRELTTAEMAVVGGGGRTCSKCGIGE